MGSERSWLQGIIWDQFSAAPLVVKDKESNSAAISHSAVRGKYTLEDVSEHSRMEEDICELSYQVMGCLWPCTQARWGSLTGRSGWWSLQSQRYWEALRDTKSITHKKNNVSDHSDSTVSTQSPDTGSGGKYIWMSETRARNMQTECCVYLSVTMDTEPYVHLGFTSCIGGQAGVSPRIL